MNYELLIGTMGLIMVVFAAMAVIYRKKGEKKEKLGYENIDHELRLSKRYYRLWIAMIVLMFITINVINYIK